MRTSSAFYTNHNRILAKKTRKIFAEFSGGCGLPRTFGDLRLVVLAIVARPGLVTQSPHPQSAPDRHIRSAWTNQLDSLSVARGRRTFRIFATRDNSLR